MCTFAITPYIVVVKVEIKIFLFSLSFLGRRAVVDKSYFSICIFDKKSTLL